MRPGRALGAALAAGLLAAAAAGCGGGGKQGNGGDGAGEDGGATTGTTAQSAACRLLTTAQVTALFGHPASTVPGGGTASVASGCLWQAQAGTADAPTLYQLQLSVYEGGAFDTGAWGGTPEPIAGLGDQAFVVRNGAQGTTAGYRDGDRSVFLTYGILLDPKAPSSARQADQVVGLLRAVQARLGG
jgi:hypothetical protein